MLVHSFIFCIVFARTIGAILIQAFQAVCGGYFRVLRVHRAGSYARDSLERLQAFRACPVISRYNIQTSSNLFHISANLLTPPPEWGALTRISANHLSQMIVMIILRIRHVRTVRCCGHGSRDSAFESGLALQS